VSTLHITNGDCAADVIRLIVDDPVVIAADVLHEGPCPAVDDDAWHDIRARFLAAGDGPTRYEQIKASLAETDQAIAGACRRGDEIVLWFEHDLFDQLELVRMLDLVGRFHSEAPVSLICIDRFPGVEPFYGLGQLTRDQMATLTGTGVRVTEQHITMASAAWNAFRSPDPRRLIVISESRELPFLRPALRRFLAEYPSMSNGLSQTEELALEMLMRGAATGGDLFVASHAFERAPFMGDTQFFAILHRLASATVPLVSVEANPDRAAAGGAMLAITDAGREVNARRADHVRLNGIDVWRGGVHLVGSDRSPWRWDAGAERLVS
jgi:hypothetical protein